MQKYSLKLIEMNTKNRTMGRMLDPGREPVIGGSRKQEPQNHRTTAPQSHRNSIELFGIGKERT